MAKVKFSIAVDQDVLDVLDTKICVWEDRKRNYIINKAIALYIENYKKEHPEKAGELSE